MRRIKIAIAGAGIYGTTTAMALAKKGMHVTLYDPLGIMCAASVINQFRVHRGYHYPRSDETIIDMQLPGAILSFHWKFESLSENRTRITQRLTLSGGNAEALVAQASMLEKSTPEGMEKLAVAIAERVHS